MARFNPERGPRATTGAAGSRATGDAGRKKRGGVLRLLLLLLAIIAVVVIVSLVSCGSDDPVDTGASATTSAAAPPPTSPSTPSSNASSGTLTAGGTSLIGGQNFANLIGQQATGSGLTVLSTTEGGFVVGQAGTEPTSQDAVFVEYGSMVGADESGSTYRAQVGDEVDLAGPVREAPENPGRTLDLGDAEAALVKSQGAYVNADTVEQAAG